MFVATTTDPTAITPQELAEAAAHRRLIAAQMAQEFEEAQNATELSDKDRDQLEHDIQIHQEEFAHNTYDEEQKSNFNWLEIPFKNFETTAQHYTDKIARYTFGDKGVRALHELEDGAKNFFNPHDEKHFVAKAAVLDAIKRACEKTGCDYKVALEIAGIESGFHADASNPRSSARGLYQALKGTAEKLISDKAIAAEIGRDGGYQAYNPYHSALVGTLYAVQNAKQLETALHHKPSAGEIYLAHFLGVGGAINVLKYNRGAELRLSEKVLQANPNLRSMTTVGDIIDWADRKMASVHVDEPAPTMVARRDNKDDIHHSPIAPKHGGALAQQAHTPPATKNGVWSKIAGIAQSVLNYG